MGSALTVAQNRLLKPGRTFSFDRRHDLRRNLVLLLAPDANYAVQDQVRRETQWTEAGGLSPAGGVSLVPSTFGLAWTSTAGAIATNTDKADASVDIATSSGIVVADFNNNGNSQIILTRRTGAIGTRSYYVLHNTDGTIAVGTNIPTPSNATSSIAVDGPHVLIYRRQPGSASTFEFFLDGDRVTSTIRPTGNQNTSPWLFGRLSNIADTFPFAGKLALAAVWGRPLQDSEVQELSRDPFVLIRPADVIWIPSTVSGVSGSGAITEDADTVAGSGTVAISGSGAITEDPDTVTGSGTVAIGGSAAITEDFDTVAGSGTVSGAAGVTGSAAIVEDLDVLAGSGSVLISGTGAIIEDVDVVASVVGGVPRFRTATITATRKDGVIS